MKQHERAMIEDIIRTAKEVVRKGGQVRPMFFMRLRNKIEIIDLQGLPNKDLGSAFMRLAIVKKKPDEYVFICESWIKKFDTKNENDKKESKLVAQGVKEVNEFDDKNECILIVHGMKETREKTGVIVFERIKGNVKFSELEWLPQAVQGRFSNLWNPFGGDSKVN